MDYHETLQALKDLADAERVVEVHVRAVGDDQEPAPVLLQGALECKWHPEVVDPPTEVVFFVGEAKWSSFLLSREHFADAERGEDGTLRVTVGRVVLDVREAPQLEAVEG